MIKINFMENYLKFFILLFSFIFFLPNLFAQVNLPMLVKNITENTKPPVLIKGCTGEYCGTLQSKKVMKKTTVYASASELSKSVSHLLAQEDVLEANPYTLINKFGTIKLEDKKNYKVISYLSEGQFLVMKNGKQTVVVTEDSKYLFNQRNKVFGSINTESWFKVKLKNEKFGWVKSEASVCSKGVFNIYCP